MSKCHLLSTEVGEDDAAAIFRPGVGVFEAGGEEGWGGSEQQAVAGQHLLRFYMSPIFLILNIRLNCFDIRLTWPPSQTMSLSAHKPRLKKRFQSGWVLVFQDLELIKIEPLWGWTLLEEWGKMRCPSSCENGQPVIWRCESGLGIGDRQSHSFLRSLQSCIHTK